MKHYILKISLFTGSLILLFTFFILLPPTPRASKSLLFAEVKKDSLLVNTPYPRIIFVGGSNLSFGLNSQDIKDSLNINPINTSIHASIGLKYMLENTMQYVQNGDIIVLIPEYSHFFNDWNRGSTELLRTIIEVNRKNIRLLNKTQIINNLSYIGAFVLTKLSPIEFVFQESDIYSVNSFNGYGDVETHWNLENRHDEIKPITIDVTKYNPKVMIEVKRIAQKLQEKGCVFLVSYPCFQETSFNESMEAIRKVEEEYRANGFTILGTPQRYMAPDSLMFNTLYHLNKPGVERRTELLIEDLRAVQKKKKST